ncbi:unnamed protein product [Adineta ricciae]|uniref:Uncharacterized protein n=1 Tax=Adineta ricciae TaxID=249248 RepID=A0A813MMS0_ADIRI|nr:unnamed protein product [Adineta ricciae]
MTCARIRVKIHGSTQVILLPIDSDRGLRLGTFNCYFQAAKGIAYYNDAHAIVGLDFNDESRKFFPGPNEEWQENIDYFPTYANGQLTPPSANEAASSAITSCLTFDKDGLWDIRIYVNVNMLLASAIMAVTINLIFSAIDGGSKQVSSNPGRSFGRLDPFKCESVPA